MIFIQYGDDFLAGFNHTELMTHDPKIRHFNALHHMLNTHLANLSSGGDSLTEKSSSLCKAVALVCPDDGVNYLKFSHEDSVSYVCFFPYLEQCFGPLGFATVHFYHLSFTRHWQIRPERKKLFDIMPGQLDQTHCQLLTRCYHDYINDHPINIISTDR